MKSVPKGRNYYEFKNAELAYDLGHSDGHYAYEQKKHRKNPFDGRTIYGLAWKEAYEKYNVVEDKS
jgi:hypothetical protein